MMLRIDRPIVYQDIYNVVALASGHPVFKLEGWGDDSGRIDAIVIKLEMNARAADVGLATKLMNVVDSKARTHVLSSAELDQLKTYVGGGNVADQAGLQASNDLQKYLGLRGTWTKMPLKQLLTLDNAVANRLQGDKADIRVMARALKGNGGLEQLGKIIAVDLFNGCIDRFVWPPPGQNHPQMPARFQTILNLGNVFVAIEPGRAMPIGLDSFDPNNQVGDVRNPLNKDDWGGMLLMRSNEAARLKFVEDVIADLEMALGPRNRKNPFGSQNRLGRNRKQRLLNGMRDGKRLLELKLVPWKSKPNVPRGLLDRIAAMGW